MPIDVTCQCGARFRASDRLAGRYVACPKCAGKFAIPAVEESLAPIQRSSWQSELPAVSRLPANSDQAPWATPGPQPSDSDASRWRWLSYDFAPKQPMWRVVVGTLFSLAGIVASVLFMVACSFGIDRASETSSW